MGHVLKGDTMFINDIVALRWDNAVKMAFASLKPSLSGLAAQNFVSGKAPKAAQYLDVIAAVEGYSCNIWATVKQVESIGGTVAADAPKYPIFWQRKSAKTGKMYYQGYYVVNFDEVTLPADGLESDAYDTAMAAFDATDTYAFEEMGAPSPIPVCERKATAIKNARINAAQNPDLKKIHENLVLSERKTLDTTPQKRGAAVEHNNRPDMRTKGQYTDGKPMASFKLDLDEFGIHVEANTMADATMLLEKAVDAYLKLKA